MRSLALAASAALVVIHAGERGPWFWVGLALVALNVGGFLWRRFRADQGLPSAGQRRASRQSHRLDELLSLPDVAAALAEGPRRWRQVSHLETAAFEPTTAQELAAFVWIEQDDEGWTIALGDEVWPYVDLDMDEAVDPVIEVLVSHPGVEGAFHEDREVYRIEQRRPLGTGEVAELAARALVSHHVRAAGR
jgi:hypothetical protein